jgi:hypothetical protein
MYPLAIALLGAAGAWLAWRRNPLYSADSALRLFAVSVLSIAAASLLIIAAVDHTSHRAEPVLFTTILTVVILGTLALLYVAQAASIFEAAQLTSVAPPGAKSVHLHRKKVYHRGKVLVLLLVSCALLAAMSPGAARYVVLACAAMLALIGALLFPAMHANALKFDQSLAALECAPWVHWRYTPEQWQRWSQVLLDRDAGNARSAARRPLLWLLWILGLVAAGLLVYSRGSLAERVDYTLLCAGGILVTILMGSRLQPQVLGRLDESGDTSPDVFFGPDGLFANGAYMLWLGVGVHLVSASIDAREPKSAEFMFERVVPNPYGPNHVASVRHCMPIPAGCDSDLELLQRELKARCPKARIGLA